MENKNYFWDQLARDINSYLDSVEKNGIAKVWIDDIVNPEMLEVNAKERRIIASSYSSEDGGKSFLNYKISIETTTNSIDEFIINYPFSDWQDMEGKVRLVRHKRRVTLDAK